MTRKCSKKMSPHVDHFPQPYVAGGQAQGTAVQGRGLGLKVSPNVGRALCAACRKCGAARNRFRRGRTGSIRIAVLRREDRVGRDVLNSDDRLVVALAGDLVSRIWSRAFRVPPPRSAGADMICRGTRPRFSPCGVTAGGSRRVLGRVDTMSCADRTRPSRHHGDFAATVPRGAQRAVRSLRTHPQDRSRGRSRSFARIGVDDRRFQDPRTADREQTAWHQAIHEAVVARFANTGYRSERGSSGVISHTGSPVAAARSEVRAPRRHRTSALGPRGLVGPRTGKQRLRCGPTRPCLRAAPTNAARRTVAVQSHGWTPRSGSASSCVACSLGSPVRVLTFLPPDGMLLPLRALGHD